MNLSADINKVSQYFKNKRKENLVAGTLIFVAAIIFATFIIQKVADISVNNMNYSQVLGWITYFDNYTEDVAAGLLLLLPSVALFAVGYLMLESHPLGWKISYAVAAAASLLALTGLVEISAAVPIAALTAIAASIDLKYHRSNRIKQSSIIMENIAKLGLRVSGSICVCVLLGMIIYVGVRGSPNLSLSFLTGKWDTTLAQNILKGTQTGDIGGISNFVIGTLMIVAVCEFIAIPLGLSAAIYLSEYAPQNKFTSTIRFFIETLAGVPSIVIGLVGYMFFCDQLGWGVCLLAAGLSLMMMILPWNIRVAEEAMRAVPTSYREGAYALGSTQSQAIGKIILFASSPGIITGIILGIGAAMGETAVILLTAGAQLPRVLPSGVVGAQAVPALTIWIDYVGGMLLSGGVNLAKAYNVAFSGAFVLISIFIIICIVGLYLRNYLTKKINGN